jgi:hypothetical protein
MQSKRIIDRWSRDYELPTTARNALASTLLSRVTEETLSSFVFGLMWAVPKVRRRCIKILLCTFLMGAFLGGYTVYYVSGLFSSNAGTSLVSGKVLPNENK